MTDDAVLGITMTNGSAEAGAEIALAADLPRRTAEFRAYLPPSECKGEAESVTLSLGGKELLSAEVPPADGGLLGAEASVAVISVTEGCADGGAALSDMLAGLSGGLPGLDCILGDGTRVTLAATVEKSGDGVSISASAPEGAKLFVITAGGDGAAVEAAQERISASETIVCTVPGCITTSEICGAALQGAQAREAFRKAEALETELSTAESIASIRNTMDTTDAFYDAEVAYFNENLPALIPVTKAFTEAIVNGPFRADFEREYGAHFIRLLENSLLVQDARIIGDLLKSGRGLQNGVPRRNLQFLRASEAYGEHGPRGAPRGL